MSKWSSPYQKLPREKIHRLNVDVSLEDCNLIRSIVPRHGFLTTFVASFFQDIVQYARQNNLTYNDSDQFESYIRSRAVTSTADTATTRNERSGTSGDDDSASSTTHKPTSTKKRTSRRGRSG